MTTDTIPARTTAPDAAIAVGRPDFDQIYREHFDKIYRYVWYRTFDRSLAEEITGDTFIRAWRYLDGFTPVRGGMPAWLTTIARNLINDHYKSSRVRCEITVGEVFDSHQAELELELEPSPEDRVVGEDTRTAVRSAVQRLNHLQRACITARFLEGLSVAETAARLGRNESAVKTLQSRAVAALARDLILIGALTS